MNNEKIIPNLYEHFKDSPKKLKIVCDWDEVIQATEPYETTLLIKNEVSNLTKEDFIK